MTTESQDATPTIEEKAQKTSRYLATLKEDIEAAETTETAEKPRGKKAATKAMKKEASPAVDRRSEAADTILGLVKKAGKADGANTVATLAAKLAKGTITHAQLVSLRDAIKTLSQALRDDNKAALAKQLANANRAVRRLERASRKGER